jgi:hypothetical protein
MFCAPGLVFGGTESVGSRFLILRSRTHFRRYQGRPFSISCFACPNSFSAVPRAWGPVFMFSLADSFLAVPRESCPVFMFCAPGLVFGGIEGVMSRFYVLRPGLVFRGTEGVRSRFHLFVLPNSFTAVPMAYGPFFMVCALGLVFGGTEGVGSRFFVFAPQTRFRRYRRRRVPFSCFARPDSFSAIPRVSGPVFMFRAPGLIFSGTEGVESRFLVLRSRIQYWRYRGSRVPFLCFVLPDSFTVVPMA